MQTRNRAPHAPRRGIGFTLIELIVAIGAMALIAVGIASIFEAVGRTVSGGRRVSNLNQYAALIERQMRDDFQAMTRDGVLLIRNQEVNYGAPIPLHIDDTSPRTRRADQLIFFVRGDFSSARSPLIPGVNATSKEAMIHYGHGMRLDPIEDYATTPGYEAPEVDDGRFPLPTGASPYREELGLGVPDAPEPREDEPNRYASDWTLNRWVRLLVPPASAMQDLPQDPAVWTDLGLAPINAIDSEIQIAGQPAAPSAFTTLAARFPTSSFFPGNFIRGAGGDTDRRPTSASGLVDILTTDLAEIRRIIMDAGGYPWDVASETDLFDPSAPAGSLLNDVYDHTGPDLPFIQAWMDDLFPTNPHPRFTLNPDQTNIRPRSEPALPDLTGTLTAYDYGTTGAPVFVQNFRLADQQILGSAVFVPRCTEFIVEYSFGQVVDNDTLPQHGQLVWFGKERTLTIDGNTFNVVTPYPDDTTDPTNNPRLYAMPYTRLDGSQATRVLQPGMLYDALNPNNPPEVLTAHFGYTDPTYLPGDPLLDPATVPWAWPKLIRITISLADPSDPSIEQTFQFIFETPEADAY